MNQQRERFFDLRTAIGKALALRKCDAALYRRRGRDYRGALLELDLMRDELTKYQQRYNKGTLELTDIGPMSKLQNKATALASTIPTERKLSYAS